MLLTFCILKFVLLIAFIVSKVVWFKFPLIKIKLTNLVIPFKSCWVPLFKKKSYFFYFLTFNNFQKYWYVMLNLIYYYIYIKPIISNLPHTPIFIHFFKKKNLVIQYKFMLNFTTLNKKKIIYSSYYIFNKLFTKKKLFLFL